MKQTKEFMVKFADASYEGLGVSKDTLLEVVDRFLEENSEIVPKRSSGRSSTKPGDAFDGDLCHCRLYDKSGHHKQCSASKQGDTLYCKLHQKKIAETDEGVWKFGNYNEDIPTEHLSGKDKGKSIAWKMDGFSPVKRSPSKKSSKEELPEGHLPRPRGRGPVGKVWDSSIGEWVDKPQDKTIDASLKGKKVSELKKVALERGISQEAIDGTEDEDNRKLALMKLIGPPKEESKVVNQASSSSRSIQTAPNLGTKKVSELKKIAVEKGISQGAIDETDDEDDRKGALITLINAFKYDQSNEPSSISDAIEPNSVKVESITPTSSVNTEPIEEKDNPEMDESAFTFEGVEYMWDKESGELTNPDTYDLIGTLAEDKGSIKFQNDEMKKAHEDNENYVQC